MANKKIISIVLCAAVAMSLAACSSSSNEEETTTAETTTTEETTVETEPTGRPYDQAANEEFEEEKMYEVIKDCEGFEDMEATTPAEFFEGQSIVGVSTDGYYIMQDSGYIIPADCLQEMDLGE